MPNSLTLTNQNLSLNHRHSFNLDLSFILRNKSIRSAAKLAAELFTVISLFTASIIWLFVLN